MSNELESYALASAGVLTFVGFMFMVKCRVMWHNICLSNPWTGIVQKTPSDCFTMWGALVSHVCFVVGMVSFGFGIVSLGLYLDYPPALAIFAGSTGIMAQLFYMVIFGRSPMGLPGVHGPPIPARVILVLVQLFQFYAFFTNVTKGVYKNVHMRSYAAFLGFAICLPMVIAAHHRANGWKNQPTGKLGKLA